MVGAVTGNALGVAGRRAAGVPKGGGTVIPPVIFGPGTWTFIPPISGTWVLRLFGSGGYGVASNNNGGGGGGAAFCKKTLNLAAGMKIPVTVDKQSNNSSSTISLPGGTMTAGSGTSGSVYDGAGNGGLASGGDVNLSGVNGDRQPAGSYAVGGSAGAGDAFLPGGLGGQVTPNTKTANAGGWPGGGGATNSDGAAGVFIATYQGP